MPAPRPEPGTAAPGGILVLGAGRSGLAAARLARSRHRQVTLLDEDRPAGLERLERECRDLGIRLIAGFRGDRLPEGHAAAVLSPGIAKRSRLGVLAQASGIPLLSELAYAARHCPWPAIGVTGSNGKTTTVEMLAHCLNAAGRKTLAGGNIGLPLSQIVLDSPDLDCVVLEISTFQMEFTPPDFATRAAALLNITPDHLDRHGSYQAYQDLKTAVLRSCPPEAAVCNEDLPVPLAGLPHAATFSARPGSQADFQVRDGCLGILRQGRFTPLVATGELPFTGRHNWENALAVLALAERLGIPPREMVPGMRTFHPGPHRLQLVAEAGGVAYIDDSKATNADAVVQALAALAERRGRIRLIAGGVDKGCDLKELVPSLQNSVRQVYLIGACRERLRRSWRGSVPVGVFDSLEAAVRQASADAEPGDAVLLSPACASQDMFQDYAQRGRIFAEEARRAIAAGTRPPTGKN